MPSRSLVPSCRDVRSARDTACAGAGTDLSSFLGGDILDRQPRDLVEFMLRVAVLPRFNAELCAHLTGDPTAPQRLSGPPGR